MVYDIPSIDSETKKSFFFPLQYGVGIVDFFPDSRVPNLCKPPSPFYKCAAYTDGSKKTQIFSVITLSLIQLRRPTLVCNWI